MRLCKRTNWHAVIMDNLTRILRTLCDASRAMIIVDASKSPDADQTLAEGKYLMMKVHMPPTMDDTVRSQVPFEVIKTVDREKHRLSWINIDYPQWALRAERWQVLSTVDGKTLYETREVFAGLLAYILKWFMAGSLRKSFDAFADGLKHRSEQL